MAVPRPLGHPLIFEDSVVPSSTDDATTIGARIGMLWRNKSTQTWYICEDPTPGSAIWSRLSQEKLLQRMAAFGPAGWPIIDNEVVIPPMEFSRAHVGNAVATGRKFPFMRLYQPNEPRFNDSQWLQLEGPRTNLHQNPLLEDAVPGTPGTFPLNVTVTSVVGLTWNVAGEGFENGTPYNDFRISGLTTGATGFAGCWLRSNGNLAAAADRDQIATTHYFKVLSGTVPSGISITAGFQSCSGASTIVLLAQTALSPFGLAGMTEEVVARSQIVAGSNISHVRPSIQVFSTGSGINVDFTIRVYGRVMVEVNGTSGSGYSPNASTPVLCIEEEKASSTVMEDVLRAKAGDYGIGFDGACTILTAWRFTYAPNSRPQTLISAESTGGGVGVYLIAERGAANRIRNGRFVGSEGFNGLPTNIEQNDSGGLTWTFEGRREENGNPVIDIRFQGTYSGTPVDLAWQGLTSAANFRNTFTHSIYVKIKTGSLANVDSCAVALQDRFSGGGLDAETEVSFTPGVEWARQTVTRQYLIPLGGWSQPVFKLRGTAPGVAIDVTLSFSLPFHSTGLYNIVPNLNPIEDTTSEIGREFGEMFLLVQRSKELPRWKSVGILPLNAPLYIALAVDGTGNAKISLNEGPVQTLTGAPLSGISYLGIGGRVANDSPVYAALERGSVLGYPMPDSLLPLGSAQFLTPLIEADTTCMARLYTMGLLDASPGVLFQAENYLISKRPLGVQSDDAIPDRAAGDERWVQKGFPMLAQGAGLISTPSAGSDALDGLFVKNLAVFRSGSQRLTGAIVFTAPDASANVLYSMSLKGLTFDSLPGDIRKTPRASQLPPQRMRGSPSKGSLGVAASPWFLGLMRETFFGADDTPPDENMRQVAAHIALEVSGYRPNGGNFYAAKKRLLSARDAQIRWGFDAEGKTVLVLGNELTEWHLPHIWISECSISGRVDNSHGVGWTSSILTTLSSLTLGADVLT